MHGFRWSLLSVIACMHRWACGGEGGPGTSGGSVSRSCPLQRPDAATIAADSLRLIRRWAAEQPPGWGITSLYISCANFVSCTDDYAASCLVHRHNYDTFK